MSRTSVAWESGLHSSQDVGGIVVGRASLPRPSTADAEARREGFAVREGQAVARQTRRELRSQALQQHGRSTVPTSRVRVAPTVSSPIRSGTMRMSGLSVGGGSGGGTVRQFVRTHG